MPIKTPSLTRIRPTYQFSNRLNDGVTLRDDRRGARKRLLEAEPWDLVIVDEAHHLSVDERNGETLAYRLNKLAVRSGGVGYSAGTGGQASSAVVGSLMSVLNVYRLRSGTLGIPRHSIELKGEISGLPGSRSAPIGTPAARQLFP